MGFSHPSAGTYVVEEDRSQRIAGISTSIGAIVGESHKGPVNQRTLITNTREFIEQFGPPDPSKSFMHYCALSFLAESSRLYVTRVDDGALTAGCVIKRDPASVLNESVSFADLAYSGQTPLEDYPFNAEDLLLICAVNPGEWGNDYSVRVYPNVLLDDNSFYIDVFKNGFGYALERYLVTLNYSINGLGIQTQVETHIQQRSPTIRVRINPLHEMYVADPSNKLITTVLSEQLSNGANGTAATMGDILNGWYLYEDVEEIDINIMINGGYSAPAIQLAMDEIARNRMDCVAILDVPSEYQALQDALNYRRLDLALNSSYSALYSPDVFIADVYNGISLYVPPSGHIAAVYALTDRVAATWFAPAGLNRGVLNVLGLRHTYDLGARDAFADSQINPIRIIKGSGIVIWAADTLQTYASALSNVPVRRLMNFLEKSIALAANYSVFEPADDFLRAKLVALVDAFMTPIQNSRGVEYFEAICDGSNNPPEVVANGDVVLDVYVDPTVHTKRVLLNAVIDRTGGVKFAVNLLANNPAGV